MFVLNCLFIYFSCNILHNSKGSLFMYFIKIITSKLTKIRKKYAFGIIKKIKKNMKKFNFNITKQILISRRELKKIMFE